MNKICIIGLGYVGLPLAIEFGKKNRTVGFDVNKQRIDQLNELIDVTGESSKHEIQSALKLSFTSNVDDIKSSNIYIISVPTPVNANNKPNIKIKGNVIFAKLGII